MTQDMDAPADEPADDDFKKSLEAAINRHSMENGSNTPDFILATYFADCLRAFDTAIRSREKDDSPLPAWPDEAALRDALDMLNRYANVIRSCHSGELERFDYLPRVEEVIEALGVYVAAPAGEPAPAHEIERLRAALENLELQGIRNSICNGWVCIPEVEWDAVMGCWYCGAAQGDECQKPFADVSCRRVTTEPTASASQGPGA